MSSVHSPRLDAGALGPVARRHRRARVRTSAGLVQQAWADASARLNGGGALVVDLEEVKRLLSTRVAGATEAVHGAIAGAETAYSALVPSLQHLGERLLAAGSGPEALAARHELVEMLSSATHAPGAPAAASALALAAALAVAAAAPRSQPPPSPAEAAAEAMTEEASGLLVYDPEVAAAYFRRRPLRVLARSAGAARLAGGWLFSLALDRALGREEAARGARAQQLRETLTRLGPAAVKIGQVLSARVDLLPPAYLSELRRLQDAVPPFCEAEARAILAAELPGAPFARISPAPLASASLGQVYRAELGDGRSVAVKVQRPRVAEGVALDLMLLRFVAPIVQRSRGLNSDLVGLVDEWGRRFTDELDYRLEASRGEAFRVAMAARGLGDSVTAAEVVPSLCTRRVLTTRWVDGCRLDEPGAAADSGRMVGLAVAAYLTMLLDTGCLHADPHPGNLLRTREGALVVLDWGLVTEVSEQQQSSILLYIAHLVGRDYASVPADLVAMGFVPSAKAGALADSGVARVLADIFRALAKGGGAKVVQAELGAVDSLARDVAEVQRRYGNLLQIPSYFAYILRSFSVLEGIGLAAEPGRFSIAQACYPYLARRLLSDKSGRSEQALEGILYGPAGKEGHLDPKRARQLALAFRSYAATTGNGDDGSELGPGAKEALRLALDPSGGPLQALLLREAARAATAAAALGAARAAGVGAQPLAAARAAWAAAAQRLPPDWAWARGGGGGDAIWAATEAAARPAPGDVERVATAAEMLQLLTGGEEGPPGEVPGGERVRRWAAAVAPMLPELAPGAFAAALRFGGVVLQEGAERVARAAARPAEAASGGR